MDNEYYGLTLRELETFYERQDQGTKNSCKYYTDMINDVKPPVNQRHVMCRILWEAYRDGMETRRHMDDKLFMEKWILSQ